ncbi:hypothetical protein EDB85DRAFT_1875254, partial [Lactarius pseudohatsudake]
MSYPLYKHQFSSVVCQTTICFTCLTISVAASSLPPYLTTVFPVHCEYGLYVCCSSLYAHGNACGNFLPTALYVDLTLMIKNVFFCVAKAKVDTPEEDFSIVLLGTDRLENLFGCLRTMVGNDTNVDNFQLGARLTGTMESANILALHPEWDKAPRRLHLPLISKDMTTIPDAADHISPCSWRGSQSLRSVTLPTVWTRGR